MKTDKLSQQTSQTILPTATAYLRSGGSHRPSECYWIERLAQESFKSLVALEILVFTYSQFLRTPLLHLPILRFLHLDTGGGYSEYLTQWRLPRLQYVHLHFSANSTAYVGAFLHQHSTTIKELRLDDADEQRAISYCVDGLPRLNTYVIGSFLSVIAGLSQLDALLQTARGSQSVFDDSLIIQIVYFNTRWVDLNAVMKSVLQRIQHLKRNIRFQARVT